MDGSPHQEAPLPHSIEKTIQKICKDQSQPPISSYARKLLADIGEKAASDLLARISNQRITKSFSGYIITLVKKYHPAVVPSSPSKRSLSPSSSSPRNTSLKKSPLQIGRLLSFEDDVQETRGPIFEHQTSTAVELKNSELRGMTKSNTISQQLRILSKLEYRKLFLVLSYTGRHKLENVMTVDGANDIFQKKDLPMSIFETAIWNTYGNKYCNKSDRSEYLDWDFGKTHLYYCYVHEDGSYHFKGPCLSSTRTHLQRSLGDDNILIVKFLEDDMYGVNIVEEGILVGLRRFRFLVFKDERKGRKKNQIENEKAYSCAVKCLFVRIDSVDPVEDNNYILSGKSVGEVRRLFMHVHTVLTMEKYMARFSLILSKTIKLQVDFGAITVETIQDIPFRDDSGSLICDEDGKPLLHTDGTGYISEDLAMKCPKEFSAAKYITDNSFETYHEFVDIDDASCQTRLAKSRNKEAPLLMQCRLFYNGCAVKGTLLVNKKLKLGEIQIRPSMIKVERDCTAPVQGNFNSLEIVAISHKPGRTFLSKTLISLLNYGGVPQQVFLELLTNALEDTQKVYSNRHAALRVASNHDGLDFGYLAQLMISCGIPLNEPYLNHCLCNLKKDERAKLRKGKVPVGESFYLMGTADPTGVLEYDQVCVVLDNGQISGKVLVYRNPGLHFGDIHVMEAIYVQQLEDYIGDSKYGIFFSTKGGRSAPYEMATGDFDGDMYWVSRHHELLKNFKASEPWARVYSTKESNSKNPKELSSEELERELFRLFLQARKPSFEMSTAADSWLAFMDRLLTLGDDRTFEKDCLREKMIHLIDIYYDALDAPKSGKRVNLPKELRPEMYPHHMERGPEYSYHSMSILGRIYDMIEEFKDEVVPKKEIWKLPCFDIPIPETYIQKWRINYENYRREMAKALNSNYESKKDAANDVIKKNKEFLYDAPDMEESSKDTTVIYKEALAIYHVTYDYAKSMDDIGKCSFAWKVGGSALCNLYAWKTAGPKEKPLTILPSVIREVLN
ncbi:probable RNA-dependent RNA polymerase 5 isoform X1 [Sesamum indicum]|uniref:RNA-dependent RNA polymerase n=2 Tax=Sesamum indicum TaxID=4182 RepID=A0A6I9U7F1_SESIN|nr:probable RNA-dependent RNA polymerase 5 isoform X1 [Sesamum indicum]